MRNQFGAHGARATPVPMPNTEVKPRRGYNTWPIKAWENSTVPNYTIKPPNRRLFVYSGAFYCVLMGPRMLFASTIIYCVFSMMLGGICVFCTE